MKRTSRSASAVNSARSGFVNASNGLIVRRATCLTRSVVQAPATNPSTRIVGAKGLLDRNNDGILDAAYVASFKRPAAGAYRFVARYAGNTTYAASKRTLSFKL